MAPIQIVSLLVSLLAGSMVIIMRMRGAHRPVTVRSIIMPPLGMVTGFMMFAVEAARIPWYWAVIAFVAGGGLFSLPLIFSTRLEFRSDQVFMTRSKAFVWIIISMLMLRIILHDWVESYVSVVQSAGIFFILAFGMLLVWRVALLRLYFKLASSRMA